MVMTRPQRRACIPASTARVQCITPNRFTSTNRAYSLGSMSTNCFGVNPCAPALPALFTRMSIGPSVSTPACTASALVTSNGTAVASAPEARIAAAVCSARSATTSLTNTWHPRAASAAAMPAPTDCPAPVTNAVLPVRSNICTVLPVDDSTSGPKPSDD